MTTRASRWKVALIPVLLVALAACSSDADDDQAELIGDLSTTSEPLRFTGDPDSKFCGFLADIYSNSLEESATPDAVRAAFDGLLAEVAAIRESAPDEVADDAAIVVDGVQALAGELESVGFDRSLLDPESIGVFDDDKYVASTERLLTYQEQVCETAPVE